MLFILLLSQLSFPTRGASPYLFSHAEGRRGPWNLLQQAQGSGKHTGIPHSWVSLLPFGSKWDSNFKVLDGDLRGVI